LGRSLTIIAALTILVLALASGCTSTNSVPVASFVCEPSSGESPLTVSFDASASYDTDGTIVEYAWSFGDGETETGMTTSHVYTATSDKTYNVTLTVTDNGGAWATSNAVVSVEVPSEVPSGNLPPVATFTRTPSSGYAPLAVSFDAAASYDPDGTIVTYSWSFGDGQSATGTTNHTYTEVGTYSAKLTVTDDEGSTNTETRPVEVENIPMPPLPPPH